ncbi:MAG TPA: hypothetical protein DEZ08_01845 [Dehalococcoidia bacterium]|nr:hypothetical protein [Dehalococcoidia bacterium]
MSLKDDFILYNCRVISLDHQIPSANTIVISDSKIRYVGIIDSPQTLCSQGSTSVDCKGAIVIPGINDSHIHLLAQASRIAQSDLSHAKPGDMEAVTKMLKSAIAEKPVSAWIKGHGLDNTFFDDTNFTAQYLDSIFPDNPISISNQTGHAMILNSKALVALDIDDISHSPDGVVERDNSNELTGKFYELNSSVSSSIRAISPSSLFQQNILALNSYLLSNGITSVHDAGYNNNLSKIDTLNKLADSSLTSRISTMIQGEEDTINEFVQSKSLKPFSNLNFNTFKIMLTQTTGQFHPSQTELNDLIILINKHGFIAAIHAVEKEAIKMAITAFANAYQFFKIINRIEHCSEFTSEIRWLMSRTPCAISTQPGFIHFRGDLYSSEGQSVPITDLYPLKRMNSLSPILAFGSDAPVIEANPWKAIHGAVNRTTLSGAMFGSHDQRMTFLEALYCFTVNPAKLEGLNAIKSTISPGKLADILILNKDHIEPKSIEEIKPMMTIVGGKIVWDSKDLTLTFH